ncbi:MAG: hypothetical protein U0P81_14405 [Holophagaceae bacterium]
MTLQFSLALLAVLGAALWFGRGLWKAATGSGCASGCGGCGHRAACPLPRLEALPKAPSAGAPREPGAAS